MGYLNKLENINIPIALLLLQLVTYPFVIGISNQEDPVDAVIGAIIIIVPVFALLGLILRQFFKKTGLGKNMILFLDHRQYLRTICPYEIAPSTPHTNI